MTQVNSMGVSSVSPSAYAAGAPSSTALHAQLQRYQKQLSDCVNCASAKTQAGEANIEKISAQISQIKQRIAQSASPSTGPTAAELPTPVPAASAISAIGNVINVFA